MASTLELNLVVSGKDTINVGGNDHAYGFGDLVASLPITDGQGIRYVLPQGASGVDIFPRFADPGASVNFILFFHYAVEADRALGVTAAIAAGDNLLCRDGFMGATPAQLALTNNANNDVIVTGCMYQI